MIFGHLIRMIRFSGKLEKFVEAFAKEYDNPDIVDFVDGYSLGWWGECHHVILQDQNKFEQVFDWFTTLYSTHFKMCFLRSPSAAKSVSTPKTNCN